MPAGSITLTGGGEVVPLVRPGYPPAFVSLLPRLVSPAGFVLALLLFLFPFVAVSCEAPGLGSIEVSYTGADLATGGDPSVETVGDFGREAGDPVQDNENPPDPGARLLAILTLLLIFTGLAVSFLPTARLRLVGAVSAAALAGVMLVVTESVAQSNLESSLIETARQEASAPGEEPFTLTKSIADDMVEPRVGFWLTLIVLALVLLANLALAIRARTRQ